MQEKDLSDGGTKRKSRFILKCKLQMNVNNHLF
jgi:hypothetical protein